MSYERESIMKFRSLRLETLNILEKISKMMRSTGSIVEHFETFCKMLILVTRKHLKCYHCSLMRPNKKILLLRMRFYR